jgi:hypothetical protein
MPLLCRPEKFSELQLGHVLDFLRATVTTRIAQPTEAVSKSTSAGKKITRSQD